MPQSRPEPIPIIPWAPPPVAPVFVIAWAPPPVEVWPSRQTIPTECLTVEDVRVVNEVLRLMNQYQPAWCDHVLRAASAIRFDAAACGHGALACTGGDHGRVIVLARRPSVMGVEETYVSIRHEGDHIRLSNDGSYRIEKHVCGPCDTQELQRRDPIYQRDARARAVLRNAIQAEARAQEAARVHAEALAQAALAIATRLPAGSYCC
jgi:hypothetical protein